MNLLELSEQEIIRRNSMEPYPAAEYETNAYSKEIKESFKDDAEPRQVCIAGRIMSRRIMGKASFMELQDSEGRIQVYISRDDICPDENKDLYNVVFKKLLDIGDFVGIKGFVFRTQMGEISVHAQELTVLAKSLRPLPIVKYKDGVAYDGFNDAEMRYRQRYVDLVVNEGVKDIFIKRTKIFNSMRNYFNEHGYTEVDTPVLQSIPGGASARPFITHHNALDIPLYLRIANELYLKRLIVGGLERVYEINRSFRNEGIDNRHNPEFTMMESYQAYGNFEDAIALTENIVAYCAKEVLGTTTINYQGTEIDLTPPWNRITMQEGIKKYTGEDFDAVETIEQARAIADRLNVEYTPNDGIGKIINLCSEDYVEENLIQPTIVYGHPLEISPLAKQNREKPLTTERFEAFIYGRELANGYSELNDPIDQKQRFENQLKEREAGDDEAHRMDEDFVAALEYGLPPTAGLGIGIDRLVMFLTDSASIRDVLLFPLMKPETDAPTETTEEEETNEKE